MSENPSRPVRQVFADSAVDPQQVDAHLRRLDAEIRILVADRDAAVDQAAQLGRDLEEAQPGRTDCGQVQTMAARRLTTGHEQRMR
jgi:hypothetical protein